MIRRTLSRAGALGLANRTDPAPGTAGSWANAIDLLQASIDGKAKLPLWPWQREEGSALTVHQEAVCAARTPFFQNILNGLDAGDCRELKQEQLWASTARAAGHTITAIKGDSAR